MKVESKKYREAARGQDCTLRLPGICNFDPATTVLAHLPCGMRGTAIKAPDFAAIDACSNCHAVLDGSRRSEINAWDVVRALAETHMNRMERGLLTIAGMKR